MRTRAIPVLAVAASLAAPGAEAAAASVGTATAATADVLVAVALEQNPALEQIEAQIRGLEHRAIRAGAWNDPKLVIGYQNVPVDSLSLGDEAMSMLAFRLEQSVPLFGKTRRREGVVRHAAQAERWALKEAKNQLARQVKQAFYRLALARHLRALTEDHVSLVDQLIDAVRIKYEVGKAAQHNLLRLEVLRDRLRDDTSDFDRADVDLSATINGALHRDVSTVVETPDRLELPAPATSVADLIRVANAERPALAQLDVVARRHEAAADLAIHEAWPDPTFFAAYGIRTAIPNGNPGRDLVTVGVGLPLPVFYGSRYQAAADASTAQARAARAGKKAVIDRIASGVAGAIATWRRASEKVATYRERLVPKAHRALDATFASYQVDRADFLSLFEAELELLNLEKTIRVATAEGLVARTTIEMLIGKDLS